MYVGIVQALPSLAASKTLASYTRTNPQTISALGLRNPKASFGVLIHSYQSLCLAWAQAATAMGPALCL